MTPIGQKRDWRHEPQHQPHAQKNPRHPSAPRACACCARTPSQETKRQNKPARQAGAAAGRKQTRCAHSGPLRGAGSARHRRWGRRGGCDNRGSGGTARLWHRRDVHHRNQKRIKAPHRLDARRHRNPRANLPQRGERHRRMMFKRVQARIGQRREQPLGGRRRKEWVISWRRCYRIRKRNTTTNGNPPEIPLPNRGGSL